MRATGRETNRLDLLRRHSNRSHLLDDLTTTPWSGQRGNGALPYLKRTPRGTTPRCPSSSVWRVRDRLTPDDIAQMIEHNHAGAAPGELAAQYSIALTNVKCLLRRQMPAP